MCGRYYIDPEEARDIRELIRQINERLKYMPEPPAAKTGEIFPTDIAPVITGERPELMKWGFTRFDGKSQVINARLETAAEKPMFQRSFVSRRCLVPASCYFEWEKRGSAGRKYRIGRGEPIYMAGLWRYEPGTGLPRFVILTRPAARELAFIHDRMPVILTGDERDRWLSARLSAGETLLRSEEQLRFEGV